MDLIIMFSITYISLGLFFTSRWVGFPKNFTDIVCWLFFPVLWSQVAFYLLGKYSDDDDNDGEYIISDFAKAVWRPFSEF